jgi:PTH1 family peptidyl-tRNA hydrolase
VPFNLLLNWFRNSQVSTAEFESMKIVVGLGNPGSKYKGTRHNVGFDVIDALVERHAFGSRAKSKFNANVNEVMIGTTKVLLLSPLTYMNLSGQSVRAAIDFFKLDLEDLMVVCDDLNLAIGRIRIRAKGSAGGQNGIKDIINRVGSQEFPRLRLGIGRPPANWDTADYVLGKFDEHDQVLVDDSVKQAVKACESWIENGVLATMNQFNADPSGKQKNKKQKRVEETNDTRNKTQTKSSD